MNRSRWNNFWLCVAGASLLLSATNMLASEPPGLTVRNGVFYKDGKPFSGVGINYFSCFIRMTGMVPERPKPENRDYVEGFRTLKSHGIPFVRFCAGGFWPDDWKFYLTEKEKYFKLLDGLVAEAERQGIGLIPSLFWTYSTVPDLVGETLDQWGNPESRTQAFMRQYTTEMVSRYKDSPAVWGWEFGNEYIGETDLPQPELGRGVVAPNFGTPGERSAKDKMFRDTVHAAYLAFVETVRKIDKTRPVFTGDTMPRPAAWHNWKENTWKPDNPQQWKETFLADNPFDTLTVHFYHYGPDSKPRDSGVIGNDVAKQMAFLMDISHEAGKPLFIGEFGQDTKAKTEEEERRQFGIMLGLILDRKVPLSALWNYDLEGAGQESHNITESNRRAWMLDALGNANGKIKEQKWDF